MTEVVDNGTVTVQDILVKAQKGEALSDTETIVFQGWLLAKISDKVTYLEKVIKTHEECIGELQTAQFEIRNQLNVIKGVDDQVNPSKEGIFIG